MLKKPKCVTEGQFLLLPIINSKWCPRKNCVDVCDWNNSLKYLNNSFQNVICLFQKQGFSPSVRWQQQMICRVRALIFLFCRTYTTTTDDEIQVDSMYLEHTDVMRQILKRWKKIGLVSWLREKIYLYENRDFWQLAPSLPKSFKKLPYIHNIHILWSQNIIY